MTHTYEIKGMTCQSCVARVKSELLKLGNIVSADIQLASPQATIGMQQHVPIKDLQQAVSKAGNYSISELHDTHRQTKDQATEAPASYYPVFLIFGYIAGITLLVQLVRGSFQWMEWMTHFMAGFFLVFSFFKLLNLKGFAEGYSSYDVIARRLPAYGFVYPFIELLLGIALLVNFQPVITNWVILVVMGVSAIGVIQSLLKKTTFQCACLGTIIKVPLSKLTLFEDVLMVVMAAVMLLG